MLDAFERSERLADDWRHRAHEFAALSIAVELRLKEGSLPPDDAKAWAVIQVRMALGLGLVARASDPVFGLVKVEAKA